MGELTAITKENFEEEVVNASLPVLVDFWAEWCPPCRALGPTLEKFAPKMAGKLKVVKANVEESKLATEYSVMNIPTMILFKDGEEVHRMVGNKTEEQLEKALKPHL
ncbi:MAG: thioredoxin [Anaerolineales bacterium]